MAGLAAEWIKIPDGQGNLQKVWLRDSQARRDIAQMQTDIPTQISNAINAESGLMIPYGYCTTAAATAAKTVTVSPSVASLETGLTVAVKFKYANTESNPTLNVNSLGAVAIKRYGTTAAGTSAASNWNANSVVLLIYDGTYWMLVDWNNTTYSGMTDAEYQAGTGTSNRLITPARLKAAILYHAPVTSVNGSTGAVTVSVPTKTSDLTNDSGFITSAPVSSVNGQTGAVTISVPTKTSALTNDSGFLTSAPVASVNGQTGAVSLTASDVGALPSSTAIPSKTSDLTNDSGFITAGKFAVVDGTLPSAGGFGTEMSYPTGFTATNCVILSVSAYVFSEWRAGVGIVAASERLWCDLTATGIKPFISANSAFYGATVRVVLMRTDI